MDATHRIRIVLDANTKNYPKLLAHSWTIYEAISSDPTQFAAPSPAMAAFNAQVLALEAAQKAVVARVPGSVQVRKAKAAVVVVSLQGLQTYVQGLCDATPAQAESMAAAAAMKVAAVGLRPKPILSAKLGIASGTATLVANRGSLAGKAQSVVFNWQYSLDGGKTWTTSASTPLASSELAGLPALTSVMFRVSVTIGKVTNAWSQAVSLLVH
jgi:hypothetical protein